MLRRTLIALSGSARARALVTGFRPSAGVVARFVAGESVDDALRVAGTLAAGGLCVTVDRLGERTTDRAGADATTAAYLGLLRDLGRAGLTRRAELSVKLSAIGQRLDVDGEKVALDNARAICNAARNAGTTVTLDMEELDTVDSTLAVLADLRQDHPETGVAVQAYLRRTEADCHDLAYAGSRVRLCKGAYAAPAAAAFTSRSEVDRSYVRCLAVLLAGRGYPMVATHDPRLVDIAEALIARVGREAGSYEFQLLYGVRPDEQRRLAAQGDTVRVYIPYGDQWYGYLVRRLAERPANLGFFLRSLLTKR